VCVSDMCFVCVCVCDMCFVCVCVCDMYFVCVCVGGNNVCVFFGNEKYRDVTWTQYVCVDVCMCVWCMSLTWALNTYTHAFYMCA